MGLTTPIERYQKGKWISFIRRLDIQAPFASIHISQALLLYHLLIMMTNTWLSTLLHVDWKRLLTRFHSCVAIHGWGSHPLGGFKAHNDTYVWLRDSLAKDLPQLRVFMYGYTCDLTTADSISGVDDYADTFRRLLRDMRGRDMVRVLWLCPSLF